MCPLEECEDVQLPGKINNGAKFEYWLPAGMAEVVIIEENKN